MTRLRWYPGVNHNARGIGLKAFNDIGRGAVFAALALFACAGRGSAVSLTVVNFSFESPVQASSGGFNNFIPDWTITGFAGVFRPTVGVQVISVPDGSQVAFLGTPAAIVQDLGVPVLSGETYQLDVAVGTEQTFTSGSYTIELLAGSTTIASFSGVNNRLDPFIPISISGVGAGSGNIGVRLERGRRCQSGWLSSRLCERGGNADRHHFQTGQRKPIGQSSHALDLR